MALYAVSEQRQGLLSTLLDSEEGEYEEEDLVPVGGLSNTVVHISRDDEIRRVLTDRNGKFSLTDIRPGRWSVRIGNAQLPRYHRLVEGEFDAGMGPGDDVTITFRVFPIRRPLTLLSVSDIPLAIDRVEEEPHDESPPPVEEETADEPPPPAGSGIRTELARLAERRYVQPLASSPRLLSLPWGSSPEAAASSLADRVSGEFDEVQESSDSNAITIVTHSNGGRFLLGLRGSVKLTFLDLGEVAPQPYLIGVTLKFTGDENRRSIDQMEPMYREMLVLFSSRWKSREVASEVTSSVESFRSTIGEIDIRFLFDKNDGSIAVEYTDDWFVRAEASIIESSQ